MVNPTAAARAALPVLLPRLPSPSPPCMPPNTGPPTSPLHSPPLPTLQVIARANSCEYGLASGIISNDVNFINTVSRGLKVGG